MKIGELAAHSGLPVETIRYYEKIALLPAPGRDDSGYRRYQPPHLQRLLFIKRCRNLDMAQDEIRELLRLIEQPDADCGEVDELLASHLSHVRARVRELTQLEDTLTRMQQACSNNRTISECGILDELSTGLSDEAPVAPSHNHVPGSHGAHGTHG